MLMMNGPTNYTYSSRGLNLLYLQLTNDYTYLPLISYTYLPLISETTKQ